MTDLPDSSPDEDMSWLSKPAPPPRSLDPVMNRKEPEAAPPAKPKGKVTPLRPLDALGAQLDDPPIAAEAQGRPGDGLDPPDDPADPGPQPDPGEALPPAEPGGRASRERPRGEIWEGCPVKALGVNGGTSYFLDVLGQLRAVTKLERMTIMHLFGHRYQALCWHFPQWGSKDDVPYRKPGKFDGDSAASAMTQAASKQGIFDPDGAVRGVGAWSDDDGNLVYHLGDRLILPGGREVEPATHQGRIYPAFAAIPHPLPADKDAGDPAQGVLEDYRTWQWDRPELDPVLALGTVGVQIVGGALDWRPTVWLTGSKESGKSDFQKSLLNLHGGEKGLIQSTDASAAAFRSQVGQSSLPVAMDEFEPDADNPAKARAIIELARVASSGGRWMRGSSDQKGSSGHLVNTFLFSSILIPPMRAQDLSRLIVLSLNPIPRGAKPPDMRAEKWRKRGARLKRIIIDRWPTWNKRLDLWREAMEEAGIGGRDFKNWGQTMAMAQMMQSEALPSAEELASWSALVARHISADLEDMGSDADGVLLHLLGQMFDPFRRGQQYTIGQWIQVASKAPGAPKDLLAEPGVLDDQERERRAKKANELLAPYLIRVIEGADGPVLFVGNSKVPPLLALFQGTDWAGGVWSQSLKRIKGAKPSDHVRTLAGHRTRGVEIPLASLPGLCAFPAAREPRTPARVTPIPASEDDFY